MIEVTCTYTGDTAEADCSAAAVLAAKTLCADAAEAHGHIQGRMYTCRFVVDGAVVAVVPENQLWRVVL